MPKHSYRPLPPYLTIKQSGIDGLGLFATEDLKKGKCLGVSHTEWGDYVERTPVGAFVNHSEEPNAEMRDFAQIRHLLLPSGDVDDVSGAEDFLVKSFAIFLLRPVLAGEEITLNYKLSKCCIEHDADEITFI